MQQNQSQEITGQKCIDYLGEPRAQGKTHKKGFQGEIIAAYKLARLGYDVRHERPCHYDLTVHGAEGITRIQVKTFNTASDGKGYVYQKINLHKCDDYGGKQPYFLTDFDFIAAVDVDTEEVFLVPIGDLKSQKNLGVTKKGVTKKTISSYKI